MIFFVENYCFYLNLFHSLFIFDFLILFNQFVCVQHFFRQRMGNIDGWGGPLPASWYQQQMSLQQNILNRMRSLGMIPVLPGFAGHIPKALVKRLYPEAK